MTEEIREVVREINRIVREMPWCDFDLFEISKSRLTLQGSLSQSYPFDIRIHFDELFHIQCNMDWKTDTSRDVIQLIEDDEASELNLRYQVEIGNSVFKIFPDDMETTFYVVAKGIALELPEK